MVLIYAFSNRWGTNVSRRTLSDLERLYSHKKNINYQIIYGNLPIFFSKYLKNNVYSLVIGLGDYWGQTNKIRIETIAKNIYGKESIYPLAPIKLDLSLPEIELYEPDSFEIAENLGTYNCNWMAFNTQLVINRKKLMTKNLFLHLPKGINSSILAKNISDLIEANQMLE